MCGRYTLALPLEELEEALGCAAVPYLEHRPRYNVAPSQTAPVVAVGREGAPRLVPMKWGLVPSWADNPSIGHRLVNARAETVAAKPAFREAFRRRRCLVPADGFYEWLAAGRGVPKRPFHLRPPDRSLLTLAGLWEVWRAAPDAEPLLTYTILTCEPNAAVRPIHDRMPAVVLPGDRERWLDPASEAEAAAGVLGPAPDDLLEAVEVSTRVSDPSHDDPACLEPWEASGEGSGSGA